MKRTTWIILSVAASILLLEFTTVGAQDGKGPDPTQPPASDEKPAQIHIPSGGGGGGPMPQGFSYQGQLKKSGAPYSGTCNMQFKLYSIESGGSALATYTSPSAVAVTNGLFTTYVDFGTGQFAGDFRYVEVLVNCPYTASPVYTSLSPRTVLYAAPYASGLVPGAKIDSDTYNSGDVFAVTSNIARDAINGYSNGSGRAAYFRVYSNTVNVRAVDVYNYGAGPGIYAGSANGYGIEGTTTNAFAAIYGHTTRTGVFGQSSSSGYSGVQGENTGSGYGVYANSATGPGLAAFSNGVGTGAPAVYASNTHTGAEPNGIAIYATNASGDATIVARNTSTGDTIRTLNAAGSSVVFAVRNNGRVWTSAVQIYGGGDLAEKFDVSSGTLEPGTLLVIDENHPGQLKASATAYDSKVAGIVSGAGGVNPGLTLHQQGVLEGNTEVAIAGRVYVKADARTSPIKPGDLLTTSDLPGHAMKATDRQLAPGAIIGKAMTALDSGTGLVLVLVNLQ